MRVARASGIGASKPILNAAESRAIAAQVDAARTAAGGTSTMRPLDVRPVTAGGIPPLWKASFYDDVERRTNMDGRPGTTVSYSYGRKHL